MADTPQLEFKSKSFWQRPEGIAGLIPIIALGIAGFWFWGSIVPFVLTAAEDTLHLLLVCLAGGAIIYPIIDGNFRRMIFYLYKSTMRWITGKFIEIDPIGILKTYVEKVKEKLKDMDASIAKLNAQVSAFTRTMQKNAGDYEKSMGLLQAAQKKNDQRTMALEGRQVTRLDEANKKLAADLKQLNFLKTVLTRYREVSCDTILDMERDIEIKKQEREMSTAAHSAMKAAMSILKGMPGDKEMYDASLERLEFEYNQRIGEIDQFLTLTEDIISTSNLQNDADQQKALQALEKWQGSGATVEIGRGVTKESILNEAKGQLAPPQPSYVTPQLDRIVNDWGSLTK